MFGEQNASVKAKEGDNDDEVILDIKAPEDDEVEIGEAINSRRRHTIETGKSMLSAY